MNLDEHSKYRRMLAGNLSNSSNTPVAAGRDAAPAPMENLVAR
jgi:hypothetical protein